MKIYKYHILNQYWLHCFIAKRILTIENIIYIIFLGAIPAELLSTDHGLIWSNTINSMQIKSTQQHINWPATRQPSPSPAPVEDPAAPTRSWTASCCFCCRLGHPMLSKQRLNACKT